VTRKSVTRRRFVASAGIARAGAPFVNQGRYRVFAAGDYEYRDRSIALVNDSLVMDMLSLIGLQRTLADLWSG
jgi:hypothetical protein